MSNPKDWSSCPSTATWKYDVFLSFRGKDSRNSFVSHLYFALKQKGILTFKDDVRLERGKSISDLLEAIEESKFAIVIFSRNYASSRWCLEELAKIVECKKEMGMVVLPIFYKVDPSDIRIQRNIARAFVKHEIHFKKNLKEVQRWKDALKEVVNISGWHLQNRPEAEFIQDIVEMILHKLNYTFSIDTKGLIGIDSQVNKLMSLLAIGLDDVRIIGIRGMGGRGKTTLARVVYGIFFSKFEACSFIPNIREVSKKCSLLRLQQSLLFELLMENYVNIQDVDNGVLVIKNRLHHKRILLVLDDVTELDQLNKLAGEHNWFGRGSRIIITTRDEHLLWTHKVDDIYEPTELSYDEALHLFSLKAFGEDHPAMGYQTLSQYFVQYASGLPLAIKVLGSFLFKRSIAEWESALGRLKEYPEREILDVLQISFHELHQTEKEIFLHIACFFNNEDKDLVEEILDSLDLYPKIGLSVLFDKSLVKLQGNKLWMHDLLQEMGRYIVLQEGHKEPWKCSGMWLYKDIDNVLTKNMEIKAVEGIVLKLPEPREAHWKSEAFSKMCNLKLLGIHNVHLLHYPQDLPPGLKFLDWSGFTSKFLMPNLLPNELVGLRMCCNNIEQFWTGTKCFDKLKFIHLNESQNLIETPDLNKVPNLEKLVMEGCLNLRTVHQSMGAHKKLTLVNFKGCKSIESLPNTFEMESVEILILSGCSKVNKIPEFMGKMEHVSGLHLDGTTITKLPTSIGHLTSLASLNLRDCKNLVYLPCTIFNLKLLKNVDLTGCSKLDKLLEKMRNVESVEELDVSEPPIRQVPSSIGLLTNLKGLSTRPWNELLSYVMPRRLTPMDLLLSSLAGPWTLDLSYCNLKEIPDGIGCLSSLTELDLSGNNFVFLPESIIKLSSLKHLSLNYCERLQSLPNLPSSITQIEASGCISLEMLPDLVKPNDSWEPSLFLENCFKLVDNRGIIDLFFAVTKKSLQGISPRYSRYEIVIPGSEIPKWFSHQSIGGEVNVKEPSHLCNEWIGIAVCAVFCSPGLSRHQIYDQLGLRFYLKTKGNDKNPLLGISDIPEVLSDHLWLIYMFPQCYNKPSKKLSWECDADGFSQIGIKIQTFNSGLVVKKCGVRFVYAKDMEDLDQTMGQSSNCITPYEGLDVPHHNLDNSTVVVEGIKVKQSRDDYDEAGPSGEGSFFDVPHSKRIERLIEFTTHGNSDSEESSEYLECDEELSDWPESSESDLEG